MIQATQMASRTIWDGWVPRVTSVWSVWMTQQTSPWMQRVLAATGQRISAAPLRPGKEMNQMKYSKVKSLTQGDLITGSADRFSSWSDMSWAPREWKKGRPWEDSYSRIQVTLWCRAMDLPFRLLQNVLYRSYRPRRTCIRMCLL